MEKYKTWTVWGFFCTQGL